MPAVPEQVLPDGAQPATSPGQTDLSVIRNFCIIAHIDHGKSTLADRMLQFTGVVTDRQMRAQYLDRMDIERERGITIKSQAVRLPWTGPDGHRYVLNLIDTPGHVNFTYEVSRSLAACEGAILLVDAAQGIEAQTLANLYLALEADLHLIPVLNKIDLPAAQPDLYAEELAGIIGCAPADVLRVSAKTGDGVPDLLNAVVQQVPPPSGDPDAPARALIFDSVYDTYRGVVTYVRVVDGRLTRREKSLMMSTGAAHDTLEVGVISPEPVPSENLGAGEVGYLITGVKDVRQARVGDTVTSAARPAAEPLPGYDHPRPMVFSGLFPVDGDDYPELRDALDKLRLNDAALVYEPETSTALGFGFRCGFLGLLHMEIVRERLEREFDLSLISTAPNVVYRVVLESGAELQVTNPSDFPGGSTGAVASGPGPIRGKMAKVFEPVVRATVLAPAEYIGTIMELCQGRRGALLGMEYLSADRVEIRYTMPLAEIIFDFFDQLKSRTRGYRVAGLRAGRRAGSRPGQGGHPAAGPAGGRVQPDRARGQGAGVRPGHDIAAARADPAAAVRGADPGGHRLQDHRPGEHPRAAQGRAGQVLRRGHHPEAQAAGAAEGGQEADEDHRPGRGAAGSLRGRAVHPAGPPAALAAAALRQPR